MDNLVLVLKGAGLGLEHVVVARAYLTHFERDYGPMNDAYHSYFPPDRLPARTCIGVTGLARGALVEIDFVAKRHMTTRRRNHGGRAASARSPMRAAERRRGRH